MDTMNQFVHEMPWTAAEKKAARKAFDKAFERHCAAITANTKRMLDQASAPTDIWRVEEYLSEHRKTVDRIYDYRYSQLLLVFSRLMGDGWLTEVDLVGLDQEKIATIKRVANL
jgi:hypothetical protein